jgi:predicted lipoprotein with Yx(FWY)xxD motif
MHLLSHAGTRSTRRSTRSRWIALGAVTGAAALALAACGGSSGTTSPTTSTPPTATGVTISSATVAGLGTVLVNGQGATLYLLTSEQGGKLTCSLANGCTNVWPPTDLPNGVTAATAGTGVDASKLGTVRDSSGTLIVTYAGWPLYTYAGDSGTGSANGESISSFGGTWYTLTPAGTEVKSKSAASTATPGSSTTAYGY